MIIKRHEYQQLLNRLREPRRFIQVLAGPRQCGKTILAGQVAGPLKWPILSISADGPIAKSAVWLEQHWETARAQTTRRGGLLVIDEIQKVSNWSEVVKEQWDKDTAAKHPLRVLLLGSAPLLIEKGLTESLAGRFETTRLMHWSYSEIQTAFRASRDILTLTRIDKPALLRRLFHLGCLYSGQILSYQKVTGQLQDAGNTTTLAHYLDLLSGAGLLTGLSKYAGQEVRQRASSPKFLALNNALITAQVDHNVETAQSDASFRGRLVESAVGAHLVQSGSKEGVKVTYWREGDQEVDFVLEKGRRLTAIEVKSGRPRESRSGMEAFDRKWEPTRKLLVGSGGISLPDFFSAPISTWVE
jgi:predicted AAA+ superfamily ATPase